MLCLVTQSCPFFATPWTAGRQLPLLMGILQARILEWVALSSFKGSSQPRDWTQVSYIAGRFFTDWATREAQWIAILPSNSTLGIYMKELKVGIQTKTCTQMYIVLFLTKREKQLKCSSTDEWANVVQPYNGIVISHKKELSTDMCYKKKKKLRRHHVQWKIQTQNDTYYMIPFVWNIQNRQIHRDRIQIGGC